MRAQHKHTSYAAFNDRASVWMFSGSPGPGFSGLIALCVTDGIPRDDMFALRNSAQHSGCEAESLDLAQSWSCRVNNKHRPRCSCGRLVIQIPPQARRAGRYDKKAWGPSKEDGNLALC